MTKTALAVVLLCALVACKKSEGEAPAAAPTLSKQAAPLEAAPAAAAAPAVPAAPAAPAAPEGPAPAVDWTTAASEKKRDSTPPVLVKDVRAAHNEGFDRIVFELAGDRLPGWTLAYSDEPAALCGSGDPVKLEGTERLILRLEFAQAHDEAGQVTVKDTDRRPALPALAQLRQICDFEGYVSWAFGVKGKVPFRVLELSGPPRIVVDLKS